jgi:hypothetical protein
MTGPIFVSRVVLPHPVIEFLVGNVGIDVRCIVSFKGEGHIGKGNAPLGQ